MMFMFTAVEQKKLSEVFKNVTDQFSHRFLRIDNFRKEQDIFIQLKMKRDDFFP